MRKTALFVMELSRPQWLTRTLLQEKATNSTSPAYEVDNLKLAEDGHTVLIPQPSDDPDDPLNWPKSKKLAILFTMSTIAFLPEFGSAVGIPAIVPQSL